MGKKIVRLNERDLRNIINEAVTIVLNEKVQSNKLRDMIRQHGGLVNSKSNSSWNINDLYNMTDEDFADYIVVDKGKHYKQYGMNGYDNPNGYDNRSFKPIEFKDGTFMVKRNPTHSIDDRMRGMIDKRSERKKSRENDGGKEYRYENPYLNKLINGDELKPRGQWGIKGENDKVKGLGRNGFDTKLNPQALRQNHILDTYGDDAWNKSRELDNGEYEENDLNKNIVGKAYNSRKR